MAKMRGLKALDWEFIVTGVGRAEETRNPSP
jgi:hypothetical protein